VAWPKSFQKSDAALSITRARQDMVRITLNGKSNAKFRLETSPDFTNWTTFATLPIASSAALGDKVTQTFRSGSIELWPFPDVSASLTELIFTGAATCV
jgi:hypothetical protein